ncbi:hypothetical protein ORJ00_05300 [Rheinheimera baltica]|uniref:hypothetical protein n=1 Tax=Rheinheimera baltica TaxID=67576 RepID=UPI00273D069E|nr:hypothetical protein [Rheinheimera baltica]MDP5142147.1 hypothetical protein [Rheinheimera baltica]
MLASELIEKLRLPDGTSKPLFSLIGGDSSRRLFVCRFGCLEDYPTILITVDEPLPKNKNSKVLLEELFIWINEDNYPDSEVYLESIFEYPDESYDFRYFKLQTIRDESDHLILIGDKAEALELRQHYDAFDESMYADEEE